MNGSPRMQAAEKKNFISDFRETIKKIRHGNTDKI
jgi:hypothetical protein